MEKQEETKRLSETSLSKEFEYDRDAYTEGKAAGSYLGIKVPVFAKRAISLCIMAPKRVK